MAALFPGEAFIWATKSTERIFTQKAIKVRFRPALANMAVAQKQRYKEVM